MFKLNLKIALRNIWRHKLTTSIKLFGLIVGLSTVVLLVSYVLFELSYDRQNTNADEIYRLHSVNTKDQRENIQMPTGMVDMLMQEIPEVENGTIVNAYEIPIKVRGNFFKEKLIKTEPSFFKIFTTSFISGKASSALAEPFTVIVSERFAKKAFPAGAALGKNIVISSDDEHPYTITGIIKNLPVASHLPGDILVSIGSHEPLNWKAYSSVPQYILLKKGTSPAVVEQKLSKLYVKYEFPKDMVVKLMPLTKIHLYSHTERELSPNGDIKYIYIFCAVAVFILLIALVNFINLTVAAALKRGKEIGIKKVLGATVNQLRIQFLCESYIYFAVAALLVLIIAHDVVPILGLKMGTAMSLNDVVNSTSVLISIGIIGMAGLVAGWYPAVILSRLMPVKTLKGNTGDTKGKFGFRKVLMVFQFSMSALLLVGTLIIYAQLNFISNKKLGFDKDHVVVSPSRIFKGDYQSFKTELLNQPGIKSVSLSSFNPGYNYGSWSSWTNDGDTTKYEIEGVFGDIDFVHTLNIPVLKGRTFSAKYGSDIFDYDRAAENIPYPESLKITNQKPILLNEAAVKMLHLSNPIDTVLSLGGLQGKVIGVVSDFNGKSLHNKVGAVVLNLYQSGGGGYTYIKINSPDINQTTTLINSIWKKHFPNMAPDFQFLDVHLQELYVSENRMGSIFISFASVAIFLCCIGLFGMVYFDLENRTREIAVRKILGASVKDLLAMLNNGFLKIVIIGNIIIWPIAYYLAKEWLNTFYYRIELSYLPFVLALLICLLLTVLTVSFQALKTIRKSPVEALKYE